MSPRRNSSENEHRSPSLDMKTSQNNRQKPAPSHTSVNINQIQSMTSVTLDKKKDCFNKFGFLSSVRKDLSRTEIEDQPANFVEHIDAITALLIYHTYSRKYQSILKRTRIPSDSIRDDIDRFNAVYSCIHHANHRSEKANSLHSELRNRFYALGNLSKFQEFERNEHARITEEKKSEFNRVPFIPNISTYQRRCPDYNLKQMKWIRDHLC